MFGFIAVAGVTEIEHILECQRIAMELHREKAQAELEEARAKFTIELGKFEERNGLVIDVEARVVDETKLIK